MTFIKKEGKRANFSKKISLHIYINQELYTYLNFQKKCFTNTENPVSFFCPPCISLIEIVLGDFGPDSDILINHGIKYIFLLCWLRMFYHRFHPGTILKNLGCNHSNVFKLNTYLPWPWDLSRPPGTQNKHSSIENANEHIAGEDRPRVFQCFPFYS